jgi:lipoprotein-anchoring transpeptidase ErfK/SrfK
MMSRVSCLRLSVSLPALVLGLGLSGQALADPSRGGSGLGGGFIEFLMTGSVPSHRQGAPAYHPAVSQGHAAIGHGRAMAGAPVPRVAHRGAPLHTGSLPDDFQPPETLAPVKAGIDPQFHRQEVTYMGRHAPGTIVIDTPNRFLYLVQGNGRAIRYGIGVGRPGFEWAGMKSVTRKAEWPDWRPPAQMLKRRPDLPKFMAGGPENPLGARALYLGSSLYRIHGTNEPETIGRAVSSGCIRMVNEDVMDLYTRVKVGTRVVVI